MLCWRSVGTWWMSGARTSSLLKLYF
uniref:Uncharacterized protein n=1 Tax=Arundo donax TaxID=35708 RepID=A0A0A9AKL3_ARUDO